MKSHSYREEEMLLRRMLMLATLALLSAGCGSEFPTARVSGRVTLNGKPVDQVEVMFSPIAAEGKINSGVGSYGVTDADGRYTLLLIGTKDTKGAVIGKHKVRIDNHSPPGDSSDDRPQKRPKPAVLIPAKYHALNSILEFEVTSGGTDKADFDLTSP
jgi:hypothetical protein